MSETRVAWDLWWLTMKNLLMPVFCAGCGVRLLTEEDSGFCPGCWAQIEGIEAPFCTGCGRPHEAILGFGPVENFPCAACREKPNKQITRVFGAALYTGVLMQAIKRYKFQDKPQMAEALGALMADFAQLHMADGDYDVLVPVPLHKVRQRHRGYNQSTLLAHVIAECFPGAVVDESLWRIRPTRTQSRLKGPKRTANVRGAFAVRGEGFGGKRVLLIDDVVTTAGTVTECARVLRLSGAARVDVFATALAAPHRPREDRVL